MKKHTQAIRFKTILCLSLLSSTAFTLLPTVHAAQEESVELEFMQRIYEGKIEGRPSCLLLNRIGSLLEGKFWLRRGSCKDVPENANDWTEVKGTWHSPEEISLSYTKNNDPTDRLWNWELQEFTKGRSTQLKGLQAHQGMNFQQVLSPPTSVTASSKIMLAFTEVPFLDDDLNQKNSDSELTAIRIYQDDIQVQELLLDFKGSDAELLPELFDVNFDGHLDLKYLFSRGTLGGFYQHWLYNPATGLFDKIELTEELAGAWSDTKHKLFVASWAGRIASMAGVATYRWNGNKLESVESATGYILPVKIKGKLRYCDVDTSYDSKIGKVDYSVRVLQLPNGRLRLKGELPLAEIDYSSYENCYDTPPWGAEQVKLPIWTQMRIGYRHKVTHTITEWQQGKDHDGKDNQWCPVVPYFDMATQKANWETDNSFCANEKPIPKS